MPVYRAIRNFRTTADDEEDWLYAEPPRTLTVHVAHDEPVDTGLVDAAGTPLYRMPEPRTIGFRGRG